jgi:hypothetical protein
LGFPEDKLVLKRNAFDRRVSKRLGHNWLKIGCTVPKCIRPPEQRHELMARPGVIYACTWKFLYLHLKGELENLFD